MDFGLSPEQEAIREGVAAVCRRFGDDYWRDCEAEARFPREFHRAMAEGGWLGITMPPEHGGAGLGVTEAALMMHTVARHGGAMAAASSLHINMFGPHPIVVHGTPEQQARWIPPLVAGTDQACFGFTEPNAGLDTTSITTFARRVPGGYRVERPEDLDLHGAGGQQGHAADAHHAARGRCAADGRHHAVLHRPRPDAGGGPAHPEDGPRGGRFEHGLHRRPLRARRRTGSARKAAASPMCSTA